MLSQKEEFFQIDFSRRYKNVAKKKRINNYNNEVLNKAFDIILTFLENVVSGTNA